MLIGLALIGIDGRVRDFGSRARVAAIIGIAGSAFVNLAEPLYYHHDWPHFLYAFIADALMLAAAGVIVAWFLKTPPEEAQAAATTDSARGSLEQAQEPRSRGEIGAAGGERRRGFRILAPLLGLPLLVERGGRPGGVEADRAFGQRQRDDQRARDGDQRRQAGQLERDRAPSTAAARRATVSAGCGLVDDAGDDLERDVVARPRPGEDRVPQAAWRATSGAGPSAR